MAVNIHGRWYGKYTPYRKITLCGGWKNPQDPAIYGYLDVDIQELSTYMDVKRRDTGVRVTVTHAVIRALAIVLKKYPLSNCAVRGRKLWIRDDVDIFAQVAIPVAGADSDFDADLSGALIRNCDLLAVEEIAIEIGHQARMIRTAQQGQLEDVRELMSRIPPGLLAQYFRFLHLVSYRWNRNYKLLGAPRDPFGSAMVTSMGMFGIELAWAPLVPFSDCPIVIAIGSAMDVPTVINGRIVIRKRLKIGATIDHRVLDGYQGGVLARALRTLLENPALLEMDPLEIAGI